ncbi:MAG: class I SAM-dependent methyltransferase [Bryobacteraceae bacterium]|nr:class I SAM-dependent methyltransferase [Bryobacteraceae bacterium]
MRFGVDRLLLAAVALAPLALPQASNYEEVPYVPSEQWVVDEMLRLARVTKDDVVYDLGCGDGRIVITAARKFGARGVGVELRPELVSLANHNARMAGVSDRVRFIREDVFKTDLRPATVVALFLLPAVNDGLRPKFLKELRPGSRIVSHAFPVGDWKPDTLLEKDGRKIYLWTMPPKGK